MKRAALLLLLVFLAQDTGAVVAKKLTVASLAQSSDYVGTGRVVELRSVVIAGEVWTIVTVATEEPMKGTRQSSLRFRIPGGEQKVQGRTLVTRVEGTPVLNVNERALLFLHSEDRDFYDLTGFNQGYWRVEMREGKEVAVPGDVEGAGLPLQYMLDEIKESLRDGRKQN